MIPRSIQQIAQAVGGRVGAPGAGDHPVGPDVLIDSRGITPGALFVALPGERVDGHRFVGSALTSGAGAALVSEIGADVDPQRCIVVPAGADGLGTREALGKLARSVVDDLPDLRVLGITGSQGKTSTKDLLATILETAGATVAPRGSHNNEIGVPLTATTVDDRTRFLVSEMGARGIGHIAYLCNITPPQVAVVLNVGQAHLGEFGSVEAIARAKGELVEALDGDGWAVLNGTDPHTRAMADRTRGHIAWFSGAGRPDLPADLVVWADEVTAAELDRHDFTLVVEQRGEVERHPVQLQVSGRHQVGNAAAAAAAAIAAGVPAAQVATALSRAAARSRWRMEVTRRGDGLVVCNDAYNANPDSMVAACHSLVAIGRSERATHPESRTIAVLGDMLELGDAAVGEHRAIGRALDALGVNVLVAVGEYAPALVEGATQGERSQVETHLADSPDAAAELANRLAGRHDVVLVKASRSVALELVADELLGSAPAASSSDDAAPAERAPRSGGIDGSEENTE